MIISHRHRFIFFAVPRTGTHSLRHALRTVLGPEDWEQQMLSEPQQLPIAALADIGHGHISVREAARHLPESIWRDYYKFAFVREPGDRLLSVCRFLQRGHPGFQADPVAAMLDLVRRPRFRRRILVRPQHELLVDARGTLPLDRIGRFEHLAEHFAQVCDDLGLPVRDLEVRNRGPALAEPVAFPEPLADWVRAFYRDDYEAFDYPLPASGRTRPCA